MRVRHREAGDGSFEHFGWRYKYEPGAGWYIVVERRAQAKCRYYETSRGVRAAIEERIQMGGAA